MTSRTMYEIEINVSTLDTGSAVAARRIGLGRAPAATNAKIEKRGRWASERPDAVGTCGGVAAQCLGRVADWRRGTL